MTQQWTPENEAALGEFVARQCRFCKLHKTGGGRMDMGQHLCKLLWGGVHGADANRHSRGAWLIGADGVSRCRTYAPRPPRKPRPRKPDHASQIEMNL